MNIPYVISKLGEDGDGSLYSKIGKEISVNPKFDQHYVVFMNLNLDKGLTEFECKQYYKGDEKKYNYFGNEDRTNSLIYLVREADSFHYYFTKKKNKGLFDNLLTYLNNGELSHLLTECKNMFLLEDGLLNSGKLTYSNKITNNNISLVKQNNKYKFKLNNKTIGHEMLLKELVGNNDVKCDNVLIVPCIIKNNARIVISTHIDYIKMMEKFIEEIIKETNKQGICHICSGESTTNTESFSSKFRRNDSIAKIFVTTTINYAQNFNAKNYNTNFGICGKCYTKMLIGERVLINRLKSTLLDQKVVVLFEGIYEELEYKYIEELKNGIDLIFSHKETEKWYNGLLYEIKKMQNVNIFQFSLIFYETGTGYCSINKAIDDISSFRLQYLANLFEDVRSKRFNKRLKYFNLGHIYRIVPISYDTHGKALNIKRVLSLYSALLKNELVSSSFLFELASEALEKGLKQLVSTKPSNNYKNLNTDHYKQYKEKGTDWYIQKIIMSYIALIQILQKLKILDKEVFTVNETGETTVSSNPIERAEGFLEQNGFSKEAKGLFYLGQLIYQIGVAQAQKEHKDKPILDKLDYQGMSLNEVIELYLSTLEKVRQYSKSVNLWLCETLMKKLHEYLGNLETAKLLSDKENVFYIMAGYAFSVNDYQPSINDNNNTNDNNTDEEDVNND